MIGHILLALAIQLLVKLLTRSWAAGAAAASAWFISREITQAEYRWIEQFGGGLRANMPWWGGLDPRVWQHLDPWIDWIAPSLVVVAIAIAAESRNRTSQRIAKN
jgi:hypothetical protein